LEGSRTVDDALEPAHLAQAYSQGLGYIPAGGFGNRPSSAFSQTETALGSGGYLDDASLISSSQTLLEPPAEQETTDEDWLMRISQIQHQGLCEASGVWEEFMAKAGVEVESKALSMDVSEVLLRYEGEFTRRWEEVVKSTAQKMRDGCLASFAF
jgi:hypothetical protein